MNTHYLSIRSLLLALVAAVVLPLVAMLAYSIYEESRHGVEQARTSVRTLAKIIAANTSRTLATNREALETLARRPLMRLVDGARCDPILADFQSLFPRFANLTTIDMNGLAVCSAVPQPGGKPVNVARTEWFRRALAEKRFLAGNPFLGPITGKWVSVLIAPIVDDGNDIKGFMGLPLDMSAYDPNIAAAPMAPGTRYGILSANARLIWRNEDPEKLLGKDVQDLGIVRQTLATRDGEYEGTGSDGVHRFYAVAPIPEADWYAYVGVPSQPIYAAAYANAIRNSLLGLVALLGFAGLALFFAHRIARPVLSLAATARQLKDGKAEVRAVVEGPGEVAEVAAEFNEMVDALQSAEHELRRLNAELEQRVARRTAELENANKSLETFSYSVSHDLRAPLRAINGYAQMLVEDERDRLSEQGRNTLDRVTANTAKLGHLIDDVLEYSRAGRLPLNKAPVDLDKQVVAVTDDLRAAYPNADIEVKLLPVVDGDEAMLRQVFANLIGNACKFSASREHPLIEVGADEDGGSPVFYVKDNGVGFDMQYADKLFGMFQRLHRDSEFPGTGVGLSIVKQLIERHGGSIWFKAHPDAGATFFFSLA
ncbi:MAG: ATP-binding protein [Rhodocyclaceae bacterium]|nr:ATP-binding protein [Rhodocyclaceae bacterium]